MLATVSSQSFGPATGAAASWTAIVLAGQRPGRDPLAASFGQTSKALIPIAEEPMLTHVVRTLLGVPAIGRILILGQDVRGRLLPGVPWLADEARVEWADAGAGISASILALVEREGEGWPFLVTTADHPLLDRIIVEEFLAGVGDVDLAIGVVERETILSAYPDNRRTYLKFSDGAFSGANLFALRNDRISQALRFWAEAEADRKKVWRLFRRFGIRLALRAITRTISFDRALARAGRKLGLRVRSVVLSSAEAAIDVDKLSDYRLVQSIIARRAAQPASPSRLVAG